MPKVLHKKTTYFQKIVNGICGPGGPDAPKLVVPEWKREHDLKVRKNHTVEYVQDHQGNRGIAIRGLAQVNIYSFQTVFQY